MLPIQWLKSVASWFCAVLLVVTFVFVEIVYGLELASGKEALLALAPGEQADRAVTAVGVSADMA